MSRRLKALAKANEEMELALSEETYYLLQDMNHYIRGSVFSSDEKELVRRDICTMLLDGERAGRSVEDIIGPDVQAFCDAVIHALPSSKPSRRAWVLVRDVLKIGFWELLCRTIFASVIILSGAGVAGILDWWRNYEVPISLGYGLWLAGLALPILFYKKTAFRSSGVRIFGTMLLVVLVCLIPPWLDVLLPMMVYPFPSWSLWAICAAFFVGYQLIDWRLARGA